MAGGRRGRSVYRFNQKPFLDSSGRYCFDSVTCHFAVLQDPYLLERPSVTAEWSVHGFAEPKKSSVEETHTLRDSQRTTMQEYLLK
jgi:hypothetical protein